MDLQETSRNRRRIVMWETTRACRLGCLHCVVGAQQKRSALELSTYEAYKLIDGIASLRPDELIMTGGDPLEREDLFQLVDYAVRRRVPPTLTLSATTALSGSAIARLRRSGLASVALSIDASTPEVHDALRGITGQFSATLLATRWARTAQLGLEVNTLVSRKNIGDIEAIARLSGELGARRWNLYFHVPSATSKNGHVMTAAEAESAFERVYEIATKMPFAVRTFEAPQYRRLVMRTRNLDPVEQMLIDGQDVLFISHTGEVTVSPFMPLSTGNIRYQPLGAIDRSSDLLVALRDVRNLKGKCGRCEYKTACGGSRARAFATTGDAFAADPLCSYEPSGPAGR